MQELNLDSQEVVPIRRWMEYENYFNPQKYMSMYYDKTNGRAKEGGSFTDKTLFEIFTKIPATSKGQLAPRRLLEIGTGPSLLLSIFAVEKFDEIYLSDYSSANRDALRQPLEGAPGGFDWSARLEYIRRCNIPISENVMDALKSKVKGIYHCNVKNPGVITEPLGQADAVAVLLCLEAASESFDEYRAASKNVCDLLKPSGYLIQSGMLNQRQYDAGSAVFQTLSTTRRQIQATWIHNGVDILGWYETTYGTAQNPYAEEDSPDDLISYYICYGVKRRTTSATSITIQIEL